MRNREELTLDLRIDDQTRFVDGTQVHNEILIHMAQLHKFIFYIKTTIQKNNSIPRLSNDDIQRTFNNIGYEQVGCIVDNRESDLNELYSVIEYPHLRSLDVRFAHICYVKQFLHESNTRILNLTELKIEYHKLQVVTDNFTRQATRLNGIKIKQLTIDKAIVHTKDL
ncbi:unnamed protein product [Rotaria magnacalcarata]